MPDLLIFDTFHKSRSNNFGPSLALALSLALVLALALALALAMTLAGNVCI